MTAILMAGVMVGCSVQAGKQVKPITGKQQTKETVQETIQEIEPQKPTHPASLQIQSFPDVERETKAEPLTGGKRIILMTDMHYLAEPLMDRGNMFQPMVEHGDGKLTNYVQEIIDAALEEIKLLSPDALVISGDLSLQREKKSHEELVKKLDEVEKVGTTVLAMPGNHDISNLNAPVYSGGDQYPVEPTASEDFERIHKEFGYSEVSSRDANSLSYTYDPGPSMHPLMPDICQYEPRNKVGGMIETETYEWIKEQLKQAARDNMILLPVVHHNLLEESKVYADNYTIEHSEELIQTLEGENIPLFLSGHLHVQHFIRNSDIGIYGVATSSLSTPPCQYSVLDYMKDETLYYCSRKADMEKWARKNKSMDENLLNFDTYDPPVLKRIFYDQAYDAMKNSAEEETGSAFVKLIESEKQQMAKVYGDTNAACYAGRAREVVKEAVKQSGYAMWEEYYCPAILYECLEYIIEDAIWDYNVLSME